MIRHAPPRGSCPYNAPFPLGGLLPLDARPVNWHLRMGEEINRLGVRAKPIWAHHHVQGSLFLSAKKLLKRVKPGVNAVSRSGNLHTERCASYAAQLRHAQRA